MMTFEKISARVYRATNSIKPVSVIKFDKEYCLSMPEGDLFDSPVFDATFKTFEEAKRYAETYVGMTFSMKGI